jgi:Tol biopolymer transport system component
MARGGLLLTILAILLAPAAAEAAFPGQNGKIAYSMLVDPNPNDDVTTGQTDVFTITPGQFDRTNLTNSPDYETNPSWSADGTKLVFNSSASGSGLYTMDADGGNLTHVASVNGGHFPVFSPSGTRIAFGQAPTFSDNDYEVAAINVDGGGLTNLTNSPGVDLSPSWSPDGNRIAFNSARSSPSDVYTMNADGSDVFRVTTSGSALDPDWSPDGTKIAFMAFAGDGDIHVINADGTGEVNLGAPGYDSQPTWSPDGTKIAFLSRRHGPGDEVYVMNADGSGATRVTYSEQPAGAPSWQPLPPPGNEPPRCDEVRATPASLGAPTHRLLTVTISGATDPDGDVVDLEITGVTQDERVRGPADAVATTQPQRVRLRAERDANGDGRVYRIAFEASDGRGGTCTGFAAASVRKGNRAIDSAPPSYDSFGS